MRKQRAANAKISLPESTSGPERESEKPLASRVREALLAVVDDGGAAAAAKASASRTLLEWFANEQAEQQKPAAELSAAELDAEIDRVSRHLRLTGVLKSD